MSKTLKIKLKPRRKRKRKINNKVIYENIRHLKTAYSYIEYNSVNITDKVFSDKKMMFSIPFVRLDKSDYIDSTSFKNTKRKFKSAVGHDTESDIIVKIENSVNKQENSTADTHNETIKEVHVRKNIGMNLRLKRPKNIDSDKSNASSENEESNLRSKRVKVYNISDSDETDTETKSERTAKKLK